MTITATTYSDYQTDATNAKTATDTFTVTYLTPCDDDTLTTVSSTTQTDPTTTSDYDGGAMTWSYDSYTATPSICTAELTLSCVQAYLPATATAATTSRVVCPPMFTSPYSATFTFDDTDY